MDALDPASCPWERVEIAFAGDVMAHSDQVSVARRRDGTYDFSGQFEAIAPWIEGADLALANLETVFAGPRAVYDGYPKFNTPDALAFALQDAGFDALQTVNNHCLDRGGPGLARTIEVLDAIGLPHVGTWDSPTLQPWIRLRAGPLDVTVVAGTFSTNNLPLPPGAPWAVTWMDEVDDVLRGVPPDDLTIAGIHWGLEYQLRPDPPDVVRAREWVAAGADVVWGHHPHVVQPAERIGEALALYSHGNFVSGQRPFPRDGGLLTRTTWAFCPLDRRTVLTDVSFLPTWVDPADTEGRRTFRVIPVDPGALDRDPHLSEADRRRALQYLAHLRRLLDPARVRVDPPGPGDRRDEVAWAADPTGLARTARFLRGAALDPAFPEAP